MYIATYVVCIIAKIDRSPSCVVPTNVISLLDHVVETCPAKIRAMKLGVVKSTTGLTCFASDVHWRPQERVFQPPEVPNFEKWTLMWFLCIFEQTIANLLPADTSKQSCKVCRWPESFDHFQDNILQFGRNPEPFWKCLLIDPTSMQRSNSNIGCCSRHAGLHCWLWSPAWLWCVPVGRPFHPTAAARGGSVRSVRGEHWKRWNWWGGG